MYFNDKIAKMSNNGSNPIRSGFLSVISLRRTQPTFLVASGRDARSSHTATFCSLLRDAVVQLRPRRMVAALRAVSKKVENSQVKFGNNKKFCLRVKS